MPSLIRTCLKVLPQSRLHACPQAALPSPRPVRPRIGPYRALRARAHIRSPGSRVRAAGAAGFTLVELIMVIVIIGILAAVALPRLFDVGGNARAAANTNLFAAVNSAMAIGHSAALSKGIAALASDTSSVILEGNGTTATPMVYGYPSAAGIAAALQSSYTPPVVASGVATWTISGASGTCTVTYTEATGVTAPATLVQDVSGC